MTNHIRIFTLHPIGRGTLHAEPTCNDARQESLRTWAATRRAVRGVSSREAVPALTKPASSPRR